MKKVDLVITYLNSNDEQWQKDYNYYKKLEIGTNVHKESDRQSFGVERTREWDNFRYWFRGVEKNCPWVNKVFLVVQNERHVPKWLDKNHPKLRIVYHEDYIPKELLPTFNALVISFYVSNIPDLSENFICLDDDMFFINPTPLEYLFDENGPILDVRREKFKLNTYNEWEQILNNNKRMLRKYMTPTTECQFKYSHLPDPTSKSIEQKIIKEHYDEFLNSFKDSKFRKTTNFMRFIFIDLPKIGKPETDLERIKNFKYIHYDSKINLNDYSDYKAICVNDTEAMDDFNYCKEQLAKFLYYKLPEKSSFELTDIEVKPTESRKLKKVFGIISWLPDDNSRQARVDRLNNTFKQILDLWPDAEFLVIAQNWKDYQVPEFVHNIIINQQPKLGILLARKTLRKEFLNTNYDYLIMCDDDIILSTDKDFSPDAFMKELDNHPHGFMFLKYGWSLTFCAISRYIYQKEPMVDIDPQKNEGYEDIVFPYLLHYKYPKNEFKIFGIRFTQHELEHRKNLKSTWQSSSVNHDTLHKFTDYYVNRFKEGKFEITSEVKRDATTKVNREAWYERALEMGWINKEDIGKTC